MRVTVREDLLKEVHIEEKALVVDRPRRLLPAILLF